MSAQPFALPVRRPVATAMVFLACGLLGVFAWTRVRVELFPDVQGSELGIRFNRPASETEVVERELLAPLERRVRELPDVKETFGELQGSGGSIRVRFEQGTDLKVRELELQRLAANLAQAQPPNTTILVESFDSAAISRFVMVVEVVGGSDTDALRDLVDERIRRRVESVSGVARVIVAGGAPREVTVRLDPDRAAALGVPAQLVGERLARTVGRLSFAGGVEDRTTRTAVVLDGRPAGVVSLAGTRIVAERAVALRHLAEIETGTGRRELFYRVNGKPSIALVVFKDEHANLIRLGRRLRERIAELTDDMAIYGVGFNVAMDGAEVLEDELERLKRLGIWGFLIALAVLFVFLRQLRAVLVVAIAVPSSLLLAVALMTAFDQSLNLVTLFGLAVGVGMLVDNSIVVYEAVQRGLERGVDPDRAAVEGVTRTVRAILCATATNLVVFLPLVYLDMENAALRSLLAILALSIVLPLLASLFVAVGLVPLLARHLAAPAAMARIEEEQLWRRAYAGLLPPDRGRELFTGFLMVALRQPRAWLLSVGLAVLVTTFIGITWLTVSALGTEPPRADFVRMEVEITDGGNLDRAAVLFDRLEAKLAGVEGIDSVVSLVQEDGGSITVRLDRDASDEGVVSAAAIRRKLRDADRALVGLRLVTASTDGSEGGAEDPAALLGGGPAEIVVSGPDVQRLRSIALELQERLQSLDDVSTASVSSRRGQEEIWVTPRATSLAAFGLTHDQVLPILSALPREGVVMRTGFTLPSGREIPLTVRREGEAKGLESLTELRIPTSAGVIPLRTVADVRKMPAQPTIQHHDGRRELRVRYVLDPNAPTVGPARADLDRRIRETIQSAHRPTGYTIETGDGTEATAWFRQLVIPVVLLLYAVLAIAFESLLLPLLVLVALPLTIIGAVWALILAGHPPTPMALFGTLALLGLTVNPAILLVDRMQQRGRSGAFSPGAAALAAVRERARPVLMTGATTVAGLWPLALTSGREFEIWPPFATVVMGGLVISTLLTLLVMPVGYVILRRLERVLGHLGAWFVIGWVGATALVVGPLFHFDVIGSMLWRIVTTLLVTGGLLGLAILVFRPTERPEPQSADGPPRIVVRFLHKVYGQPGPIRYAWRLPELFAKRVLARGGQPYQPRRALRRLVPLAMAVAGAGYLAASVQLAIWRIFWAMVAAALAATAIKTVRRARGRVDELGRELPGGPEGVLAALAPWGGLAAIALTYNIELSIVPFALAMKQPPGIPRWIMLALAILTALVQLGRRTALGIARGRLAPTVASGWIRGPRTVWRLVSRRVFGLDLPREEVVALRGVQFDVEHGMVGILGPNGAGKTTLLRQLAGIFEPTRGRITIGGVPVKTISTRLARWIGYLPQEFGLPDRMTAREYMRYFASLYRTGRDRADRTERIERLLTEVGLSDRADDRIGSYSGGMRQRVAVARTLLRLPPVIIVDEPTVGLDPRERIRFRNLLVRLSKGRTVLFSTHVVWDVAVSCERVLVLSEGRLVFDGPPNELAAAAEGKVWQLRKSLEEEARLPPSARVVQELPEEGGFVSMRVLCTERPHEEAQPLEPSVEDGYLLLLRDLRAEAA